MTCRVQANIIDLGARQRIRKLFGPKVTISDAPNSAVSPADRAYQAPDHRARPLHKHGIGGEPASTHDTRPCDTEPAA